MKISNQCTFTEVHKRLVKKKKLENFFSLHDVWNKIETEKKKSKHYQIIWYSRIKCNRIGFDLVT